MLICKPPGAFHGVKDEVNSLVNNSQEEAIRNDVIVVGLHFSLMAKFDFTCDQRKRFGRKGDGGYEVCLAGNLEMKTTENNCLIYSFG